ncbi:hypothetical protein B0H14DRAFT_2618471 [Mycena olivaceomarginata]|nr:hypothetical protein B0H14DRAFT_3166673 [Mycena olivaceomarginata]KAJ7797874.1 hypothetical protein B0H14DRAFT_2618471 [Mycena olivaceomarginata]
MSRESLKITQKIEISAYTVARAVAFARAAIVGSGTNSAIPRLHLSSLRSTVSPSLDSGQTAIQLSFKYHKWGAHWGVQFKIFLTLSDQSTKILGMSRFPEAKYEN